MGIVNRVNAGLSSATKTVKNGYENVKKDGKIVEKEALIASLTVEIGKLAVIGLDAGAEGYGPEIAERYDAIVEARKVIEELKASRAHKTEKRVCSKCGTAAIEGMKYCGNCGALIEDACDCEGACDDEEACDCVCSCTAEAVEDAKEPAKESAKDADEA